jgi:SpoVK/Ycf46/Vps4 family AAA+-type ATPase
MVDLSWNKQVEEMFRARAPLIVIETVEEERALKALKQISQDLDIQFNACDLAEGMGNASRSTPTGMPAKDPLSLLEQIEKSQADGIYVLKDFHDAWNTPQVKRCLRNAAQRYKYICKSLVVLCPVAQLPKELEDEAVVIRMPLPNPQELDDVLYNLLRNPDVHITLDKSARERLIRAAAGLTAAQAQRAFARAMIQDGVVDESAIEIVMQEKRHVIAGSKALQFYDAAESNKTVGGLNMLKQWLEQRSRACSNDARDFGLPPPKGVLLIGIPGTGKSLTAKMIASMWQMPLLRLDVGSLFGSLVGQSEADTRQALRIVEAVAPCILWIDEMEKAMSRGGLDGGTSDRVFGGLLTWMAEKTAPCFVVATANDISKLPPELLRKGRFDEVFFLDLPNQAERKEIFAVHLKKRGRNPREFNLDLLAQTANGHVGSEIEQAVIDALFIAFNEGKRDLKTDDIVNAINATVPLSVSQHEIIENLRQWLRDGRARAASGTDATEISEQSPAKTTPIDIRPKGPTPKRPRNSTGGLP